MRKILTIVLLGLAALTVQAQITIGGSVYGGGNEGKVNGNTTVNVRAGDLNKVFGGARKADVGGRAFVNIDGGHASSYILINYVFGGNDVSGNIGTWETLPTVLTKAADAENGVDERWNAFVRVSSSNKAPEESDEDADEEPTAEEIAAAQVGKVYIGQLFGGGNGAYDYDSETLDGKANPYHNLPKPELGRTYLEVVGGSAVYAFGGGNNATVTGQTVICVDNQSPVVNSIIGADGSELLTEERTHAMGFNPGYTQPTSDAFQIGSFFGGNNLAAMAIRPTWNLKRGKIRNLYSGGNQGDMTSTEGLLLEIMEDSQIKVDNLFGGCRRADVCPNGDKNGNYTVYNLEGYHFPDELAARVLVRGGDINNVYGGNDISGRVFGGNAVGIYASVRGDVYGGGNGAYPYTDNVGLIDDPTYGDLYYNPANYTSSVEALSDFRPNAEQVSIRLRGKDADHPTIIGGSVYLGGNCATLKTNKEMPMVELKIGSYVMADKVFLGNNGESMVKPDILMMYANNSLSFGGQQYDFSQMNLTNASEFALYMRGVAMYQMPKIIYDTEASEGVAYVPYSTKIGSLYCGGNVGSMNYEGHQTLNFRTPVIIFDKVVGGCNNAYVPETAYNAAYNGGIMGSPAEQTSYVNEDGSIKDRLTLNFEGVRLQPKRWNADKTDLEWNTVKNVRDADGNVIPVAWNDNTWSDGDAYLSTVNRRLYGGNIYGGCYSSGHVNGNVIINLNATTVERKGQYAVFDELEEENGEPVLDDDNYKITKIVSGVILDEQGDDVLSSALNVFGGGYGADSEIWGSTTVNLNKGYTFQVFGGGESGAVGRGTRNVTTHKLEYGTTPDARYSTHVNLNGASNLPGVEKGSADDSEDMAECEYLYGGGFEGPVAGNSIVNLNNGRIYDSFGGSCNADILGHAETYVGLNGFPFIRDNVYGGNDLGGRILGEGNFKSRVRSDILGKIHNPKQLADPEVLTASAYIEYVQGRVDSIFGGCYGYYDYKDPVYSKYTYSEGDAHAGWCREGFTKPRVNSAFVHFKPTVGNSLNAVEKILGACQGYPGEMGKDSMQVRSYVLIDALQTLTNYKNTEVFGSGAYGGIGMSVTPEVASADPEKVSAVIDLFRGQIAAVYGASFKEGFTRRTVVNVPEGSTIQLNNIFGGGYGVTNDAACDAYEAVVNYHSEAARVSGAIYGGNNSYRRTLYGTVNVDVPVWQNKEKGYMATVYGAGYGANTWSQYTNVNLNDGAKVYEVYGGGNAGMVLNKASVDKWKQTDGTLYTDLGAGYEDNGLDNALALANELGKTCNTNVHINRGATIGGYCYGGGLGKTATVSGTTYIGLLGGTVTKDLYAGGTSGGVEDKFELKTFTATTNAYICGGTARNVYGGGWEGSVGHTEMDTVYVGGKPQITVLKDIPGATNVVIGIRNDQDNKPADYGYYNGVPTVQRNAYGGGEGGAVFGTTNLTINNGYIGYVYDGEKYVEKLDDETWEDHVGRDRLADSGNAFGGGYVDNSSVDTTYVTMWGGTVRNGLYGGGEIAAIGRGNVTASGESNSVRSYNGMSKPGRTCVTMYNGHVKRNVFGGGKGYDNLGRVGSLYTDGYVFGKTEVNIHGGEIGTDEGLASGYGNVFGGGDIGYVYSVGYFDDDSRKTETGSPDHYYYYHDGQLTEECKVVVAPWLQAKQTTTINGHTYNKYDYVPTDDLNTLPKKNPDNTWSGGWETLDVGTEGNERGVMIHNAVFAGGNVSSNSDRTYANAVTVFGNTTATLYDVYHRDFITVGTEHTGGLYGGGNLSMVDGYRELNITNYGTDYYALSSRITLDEYRNLSNRERAYFQLEYVCTATAETNSEGRTGITINGEFYETNQHLSEEKYLKLIETNPDASVYWQPYGFCSIYAGRLLNTIQRADLCGVYGSRMVLQGAKDRVADVAENVDYTINRVGELSLNQQHSVRPTDTGNDAKHGNYFGIYSIVNYMGNLTSDVKMDDYYSYEVDDNVEVDESKTYYSHKQADPTSSHRNTGSSHNQVALASGVFLELTTEKSTPTNKDYGYVTGIIELDLINVKQDQVGGGFVYAKNEHRVPKFYPNKRNVLLSEYNKVKAGIRAEATTYKRFRYSSTQEGSWSGDDATGAYTIVEGDANAYQTRVFQTSGNFIHPNPNKHIVDDCYPTNNAYDITSANFSKAHYWYVKGSVYIYDQKVSAYVGSATAYSKEVHLPLTVTAASHGKLQLLNVKPNLYAYYAPSTDANGQEVNLKIGTKDKDDKLIERVMVNNESDSYQLNDIITWWDWSRLSYKERQYFVTQTYVNCVTCTVDGQEYAAGTYVMDDVDFAAFKAASHDIVKLSGEKVTDVTEVFRTSNNVGHDTGYVLTFDMNSPSVWDDYYTSVSGTEKIKKKDYEALLAAATTDAARQAVIDAWRVGPTFTPTTSGVYGQRQYEVGQIVSKDTYDQNATTSAAVMEVAYVADQKVSYTYGGSQKTINVGTAIPKSEYDAIGAAAQSAFGSAWLCTSTLKLAEDKYILYGELLSTEGIAALKTTYGESAEAIDDVMLPAYICSKAGAYGGQQYNTGTNYGALAGWCSLSEGDRSNFKFNYDGFDLLADPAYLEVDRAATGTLTPTTSRTAEAYHSPYSDVVNVEYQAVFMPADDSQTLTYSGGTLHKGDAIDNEVFESSIRNDQRHYTRVSVKTGGERIYIANKNFIWGGTPYGKGQIVSSDVYGGNVADVDIVEFDNNTDAAVIKYYCYENYDAVSKGTTLTEAQYAALTNYQKLFVVQGKEPTETTTLYVSRESNIYDLTKERVYTVVYQYTYYENEDDGSIQMSNELHVVNIHLELESGVPQIGTLAPPATVLPGTMVGLKAPEVQPGLYEVLTSGWEMFTTHDDALHHRNGEPFTNNNTPVYWYQNGKNYVAFYSKTYLGKTYSNAVPLSVANYHDLDAVMSDQEHHMYVDNTNVDRPCKIYIDSRTCESDPEKSELDLLKDFFDLSVLGSPAAEGSELYGHATLDNHVRAARNLEFFLNSDVSPKKYTTWTPIGQSNATGDAGLCFDGTLHGDGYTVSGLSNSLFGHLCGEVYNLGVTGTFRSAGIADEGSGYLENCWVASTAFDGAPTGSSPKAVFGNPVDTDTRKVHLVNCYYPQENAYHTGSTATAKPRKAFYNGEVAYDLNGFYLFKRYCDKAVTSGNDYSYYQVDDENNQTLQTGHYSDVAGPYLMDDTNGQYVGCYVESRYADGDFRYSAGHIPEGTESRLHIVEKDDVVENHYYPIWPEDYLYFGQLLNYDYDGTHQSQPAHLSSSGDNRVYRAPAYFRSKEMGVAHFNPDAVFAAHQNGNASATAHEGLTAIDFTGHGDTDWKRGMNDGKFYQPLLDDGGLRSFSTHDITRNLLVYVPTAASQQATHDVLDATLSGEPVYKETNSQYRTVDAASALSLLGHAVYQQTDGSYLATNDHLLVDKQDFNAPFSYSFDDNCRMWYQRTPDRYVDTSRGWESVSLPFTAELVTTHQKGELTHFYSGSQSVDANGTKIGHEYWLREYRDITGVNGEDIATAIFSYPDATGTETKNATSTFLWDYYYKNQERYDINTDTYQQYYNTPRAYANYPYMQASTPYLVGFPGVRYYEFDLSGGFSAPYTALPAPAQLEQQVVTFASKPKVTIGVSDDECRAHSVTFNGFTFGANFLNSEVATGGYVLNADGNRYDKVTAATAAADKTAHAFRPYFTVAAPAGAPTRGIVFSDELSQVGDDDQQQPGTDQSVGGGLHFSTRHRTVIVSSTLREAADVRIVNMRGQVVASFTVQPGETVETPLSNSGVYVVHGYRGHYVSKVAVK